MEGKLSGNQLTVNTVSSGNGSYNQIQEINVSIRQLMPSRHLPMTMKNTNKMHCGTTAMWYSLDKML